MRPPAPSRPAARARGARLSAPLAALCSAQLACSGPLPPAPRPSDDVARPEAIVDRPLARIALGSCANQGKPQPVWDAIARDAPDLYVALGDNIYGDTEDVDVLRAKYWQQEAVPGFAALRRTVPVFGTWDDHDYGANDAGSEYAKKAESQQLFLDFLRVPADSPRRGRAGVYEAAIFGPPGRRVQLIALDLRYHRTPLVPLPGRRNLYTPDPATEASMLGPEQWAWLGQELGRPAEVRVLISSSPLIPVYEEGFEHWVIFPQERERMLEAVGGAAAGAFVVASGDRHFAEISALDPGPAGPPLYELTASGLTEIAGTVSVNGLLTDGPFFVGNYGLIDFEWDAPEPALVLRVRGIAGDELAARRVPIAPPPAPGPLADP